MATAANAVSGAVAISGYDSVEYRQWYGGWERVEWVMPNHSAQGNRKQQRREVLWIKGR